MNRDSTYVATAGELRLNDLLTPSRASVEFDPGGNANVEFGIGSDLVAPLFPSPGASKNAASFDGKAAADASPRPASIGTFRAEWPDFAEPNYSISNAADFNFLTTFESITATAFSYGLDQIANYFVDLANDALDGANELLKPLPIVNKSLAELLGISRYFAETVTQFTELVDDVENQLKKPPFGSSDDLLALLTQLPGVGNSSVTAQLSENDLRFTLQLDKQIVETVPLDASLGSVIDLDVNGTVDLVLDTALNVTFGVDKGTGTFFVADDDAALLTVTASATLDADAAARLGIAGVGVNNGTATLTANLAVALNDPNTDDATGVIEPLGFDPPPSPGMITTSEFSTAPVADMTELSLTGSANLTLPLTLNVGIFSRSGTLVLDWADVGDIESFTADTSQIADMLRFETIEVDNIWDGLRELPRLLRQLAGEQALGYQLPLIGSSVGDVITLAEQWESQLDQMEEFLTIDQLELELERVLNSPSNPIDVGVEVTDDDVQLTFRIAKSLLAESLDFGVSQGLSASRGLQVGGKVDADASFFASLRVGLSFDENADSLDRFYLIPGSDSEAGLDLKIEGSGLQFGASLGLATLGITGATIDVAGRTGGVIDRNKNATLRLAFQDPGLPGTGADDGKITLREILDSPADTIATPTLDGAIAVVLPLDPILPGGQGGLVELSWDDISDPATVDVQTSDLTAYFALGADFDAQTALTGIGAILTMIAGWDSDTKLPFVDATVGELFDFIGEASSFFEAIESADTSNGALFDLAVRNAVVAAGLDANEVTLFACTPGTVGCLDDTKHDPANGSFRYVVDFTYDLDNLSSMPFGFPGDLFELDASVNPGVQFDFELEFGLDPESGFYVVDRGEALGAEMRLSAGVNVALDRIGGSFGPLEFGVLDGEASLGAALEFDLVSPGGAGGRLGAAELFTPSIDFSVGDASIRLPMGVRLGDMGPGFITEFTAHWSIENPGEFKFGPDGSSNPADGFSAPKFELGELVNEILGPFLDEFREYNPLPESLIRTMLKPIPIIGITPLDALIDVAGLPKEVKLAFEILDVINRMPTGAMQVDVTDYFNETPGDGNEGDQDGGETNGVFRPFLHDLRTDYDIRLPILEDFGNSVIQVMLGQPVELIRWDPPAFHVKDGISFSIPLGSFFGVSASLNIAANLGFFADFDVGISTRGLLDLDGDGDKNLLDGFFIGDNIANGGGRDPFETGFYTEILAGLGLSAFGLIEFFVRGGIRGTIGADIADVAYAPGHPDAIGDQIRVGRNEPGGDDKVHLDEIDFLVSNYGPLCTITPGGQIDFLLQAGLEIGLLFFSRTIMILDEDFPLFSWDRECSLSEADLGEVVGNRLVMHRDTSTSEKSYTVSLVERSGVLDAIRINRAGDGLPVYEEFSLTDTNSSNYAGGVTELVLEGSDGNDNIRSRRRSHRTSRDLRHHGQGTRRRRPSLVRAA